MPREVTTLSSFPQVDDFRAECDALAAILEPLAGGDFERETLFKRWTVHDVVAHLHIFNYAADASIHDPGAFERFKRVLDEGRGRGLDMRGVTDEWLEGRRDREVFEVWRDYYPEMCERLDGIDPKTRVLWFGPSMSVRSSVTARQMETWAHAHEVFDLLGLEREETDRIRNIVFLGLNTFGWTYVVRGLEVPAAVPCVRLTAPSGEVWTWNEEETANRIEGSAVDFARVVTQVRNVADTSLEVSGPIATEWMGMAQCFAGPPETPPAPGTRYRAAG